MKNPIDEFIEKNFEQIVTVILALMMFVVANDLLTTL